MIGSITADITRAQNIAGASALGDLIADAQRAALETQVAFMNQGGIRADLFFISTHIPPQPNGTVTCNDLFTVLNAGTNRVGGAQDIDALVDSIKRLPQPVAPPAVGSRIVRGN